MIDINKVIEALNLFTNALAEAGHNADCKLEVDASAFDHIEHEMIKRTICAGSLGGMRTIEFRIKTARVKLGTYKDYLQRKEPPRGLSQNEDLTL